MRRMWAAGAAGLMCLALGGVPALAQEASNRPPVSPVAVSGTWDCTRTVPGRRGTSDGLMWGGTGVRGQVLACDLALSDPRVIGPTTITFNDDCFGAECVFWGSLVIEGPDGGWDCRFSGTPDPTGANDGLLLYVCPGRGGYSGLTFMVQQAVSFSGTADFGDGTSMHGLIYQGPPPPWAPLPSPASE
jgi:hypothetical protein